MTDAPAARAPRVSRVPWLPGLAAAAAAAAVAALVHAALPVVPLLTASVVLGIVVGQLPFARPAVTGILAPGLSVAAKRVMRIGVVVLGLKLSLVDIAHLGIVAILATIAVLVLAYAGTIVIARLLGLGRVESILLATGFAICGASAIGAMSPVVKARDEQAATPVALVTLCGTLAIFVLPPLREPLGLSTLQFGHFVGAGVHDVGQVVATAQTAGSAALALALVVKLTRVLMLAPMVALAGVRERRRGVVEAGVKLPPIVPVFVAGFVVAMLVRSFVPLPDAALAAADVVQTGLLAIALFGLGTAVRLRTLVGTGWRATVAGFASWALIAVLAYLATILT